MKIKFLSLMALLLLFTSSTSRPALAQQAETNAQSQHETRNGNAIKQLKSINHLMMSAPIIKDVIELKDTLNQLTHIEREYRHARNAGESQATLDQLRSQYSEQMVLLVNQHRHLHEAVEPTLMKVRAEPPQFPNDNDAQLKEAIADAVEALEPLQLGRDRLLELELVVVSTLQARQKADPKLVITEQMVFDEIRTAAPALLEKHFEDTQD